MGESPVVQVVPDRETLERQMAEMEARFANRDVPRPEHWGGYLIRPSLMEFWQGQPGRLHDRLRYTRTTSGGEWKIDRLAP